MSAAVAEPVATPAPTPTPTGGDVPIPEVSSGPAGAQAVRPAPAGTIPPPIRPYSERPESAKSKMLERLKGRVKQEPTAQPAKEEPKPAEAKPAEAAKPAEGDEDDELLGEVKKPETPKPAEEVKPTDPNADPKKGEKVNPWKLVEEHKTQRAQLEKEVAELRKMVPNAELRKQEMAEIEEIRNKNKELESRIKIVDYQSSEEFKSKYQKPYEKQWQDSMRELSGVMVEDEGNERPVKAQDLLELVNMPLAQARQLANEKFGDFADDAMAQRKTIRDLFEARQSAIANAEKEASEFTDTKQKELSKKMGEITTEVSSVFQKATDSFMNKPSMAEFFKDIDGDEEANVSLQKGYELVDRAFKANPMDPSLTPEQRAKIVKVHAAVRHRAAGFGRARYLLQKERAAHEVTRKKLSAYEKTEPNRGNNNDPAAAIPTGGSKMDAMRARLRARAHAA